MDAGSTSGTIPGHSSEMEIPLCRFNYTCESPHYIIQ